MITLSVVIPTFRGDPGPVIRDLNRLFDPATTEVIVVDDGSGPDWELRLPDDNGGLSNLSVIRFPGRMGQAYATLVGVASSRGAVVATMDDDGEHPVSALPEMLSLLKGGVSLVYGIGSDRYAPGYRRVGTLLNNCLFSCCLGKPWNVPVTSFRLIRKELLLRALRKPVRFPYLSAMLFAAGAQADVYRYSPVVGDTVNRRPSRYRLATLMTVFLQLVLHWGPLRLFSPLAGGRKERFG